MQKWNICKDEQQKLVSALTEALAPLRAKAGISQGELANLVGLTRQTISMTESKKRPMSWPTYLSLVLFFDYNHQTHHMLRSLGAFSETLVERFNSGEQDDLSGNIDSIGKNAEKYADMLTELDDKGLHSLETVLMLEYARCTGNSDFIGKAVKA